MTEKRFMLDDAGEVIDLHTHQFIEYGEEIVECLNNLHEENMMLRSKHTRLILLLKDIVNDLKRMDTRGYAEHIEKSGNINFLGMEDYE